MQAHQTHVLGFWRVTYVSTSYACYESEPESPTRSLKHKPSKQRRITSHSIMYSQEEASQELMLHLLRWERERGGAGWMHHLPHSCQGERSILTQDIQGEQEARGVAEEEVGDVPGGFTAS